MCLNTQQQLCYFCALREACRFLQKSYDNVASTKTTRRTAFVPVLEVSCHAHGYALVSDSFSRLRFFFHRQRSSLSISVSLFSLHSKTYSSLASLINAAGGAKVSLAFPESCHRNDCDEHASRCFLSLVYTGIFRRVGTCCWSKRTGHGSNGLVRTQVEGKEPTIRHRVRQKDLL